MLDKHKAHATRKKQLTRPATRGDHTGEIAHPHTRIEHESILAVESRACVIAADDEARPARGDRVESVGHLRAVHGDRGGLSTARGGRDVRRRGGGIRGRGWSCNSLDPFSISFITGDEFIAEGRRVIRGDGPLRRHHHLPALLLRDTHEGIRIEQIAHGTRDRLHMDRSPDKRMQLTTGVCESRQKAKS